MTPDRRLFRSRGALSHALLVCLLLLLLVSCGVPSAGTGAAMPEPTVAASDAPKYGGTIVVAYQNEVTTLDPALSFNLSDWAIEKMLFDALMDYDKGTTLVPQLAAEMPTISADSTVYTFKLRPNVQFHNGRTLDADDVVYSITRVLDPKTKSPGQPFFRVIKGAQSFIDGKSPSVAGIKKIDPLTVEFTLEQPDVTFLNVLALNFGFIVPREEVERTPGDFSHHPVGSGPFKLDGWTPGRQITFSKNAHYFKPELPYLDGVTVQFGATPEANVRKLETGEVDLLGDTLPAAEFVRLSQDPAWENRIVHQTIVSTAYIGINTQIKPFDDLRVRQALNMAVDKNQIVKVINGRAQVARSILPPLMPGYDPATPGYAYDPARARALLDAAGVPNGFKTSIVCSTVDPAPRICETLKAEFAQIGIALEVKLLNTKDLLVTAGTPGKVPLFWSVWSQDYPDPHDFYAPILSCSATPPGGWNWTWYCNHELEVQETAALGMQDHAARVKVYQQIFQKLLDDAVWVPVFHLEQYAGHSDALRGSPSDIIHPAHGCLFERLWRAK